MSDTNKHTGTNRLGVEPKIYTGESGSKVAKLFALLNERYVDKSGTKHENTLPVNLVLFKPTDAALGETLHTGTAISCEGKLARRTFEKDSKEQAVFEIVVAGPGSKLEAVEPAAAAIGKRAQQASAPQHNEV